ncbi:MAG: nicotinate-nucleotide adenylyltransferase [Leptolyngbyaceae cyanobacterium RU_5_1]|nr:nicotinate-nucleotide adenylyltransferase [Leptolyngbyaceae cyanobacterium RU_5_1]
MLHIALFGTSADPPTTAHQAIIGWLSQRFDWVAVWAADNPFKAHQTPLSHRIAMLRLLIDDLNPPQGNVRLYSELSKPRAIHTLEIAKQRWADAQFTFVLGADLITQLPSWYQIDELLQQVNLLVVPRPGYPLSEIALEALRQRGANVAIADLMGSDTSSTAYREHGEMDGLTPPIEDYIHREHLYAWQDAPREKQLIPQTAPRWPTSKLESIT